MRGAAGGAEGVGRALKRMFRDKFAVAGEGALQRKGIAYPLFGAIPLRAARENCS